MKKRMADAQALSRIGIPTPSPMRRWRAIAIGAALLGTGTAGGVAQWRSRAPEGARFETARLERGVLVASVTATGTLRATHTVQVGAEVSGRVARVHALPNEVVRAHQVLLELDPDQLQTALREARANVAVARAAVRVARTAATDAARSADRTLALHARGLASQADADRAQAAHERARAEVASAAAQLEVTRAAHARAEESLERANIRSPIDGVVLTRSVEPGQTIAASFQTPVLFEVAEDLARMQLRVDIDEADVGQVRAGQRASFTVDAYPARTFEATITRVDLAPRTVQGVVTYEALLDVENAEHRLRPGMTATATIEVGRHENALLAPDPALRFAPPEEPIFGDRRPQRREGPTIWTIERGIPTPHDVRIVASDGTRTAIEGEIVREGLEVITAAPAPR